MGFNLNCDECGKFIKKVNVRDIEKMRPSEAFVCDKCLKMVEGWSKRVETAGNDAIAHINQAKTEAKAAFDKVFNDRQIQDGRS